jgi:Chaperone of endosialidase
MKTTTLQLNDAMNLSPVRLALLLIPLALACFALSPQARAACQNGCDLTHSNTFLGDDALISNTSGSDNTAIGSHALDSETTGYGNVAVGSQALSGNTTGAAGTAIGWDALQSNTYGYGNSALGAGALNSNTTGDDNVAIGLSALYSNTGGFDNTATGAAALSGANGSDNVAMGYSALSKVFGGGNVAVGTNALWQLTTGGYNIALGDLAGYNLINGSNNIIIGTRGVSADDGLIRIGTVSTHRKVFIAGISGVTVANGVGVIVNPQGQLGTVVSSERYKDQIKPMDRASEAILSLKPVTFRYKHELDPDGMPQFGLVAEQVEKVNPDLVARDADGKPYTVRYEAVNAMLLNEFLKEHRKVQELEATVVQQRKDFETAIAQVTTQVQKMSAQLALAKAAPKTAANGQ